MELVLMIQQINWCRIELRPVSILWDSVEAARERSAMIPARFNLNGLISTVLHSGRNGVMARKQRRGEIRKNE